MIRVGFGFDVHRLEDGQPLWLGGIRVASEKGATGHSDADVLIHAICDALLGAANLQDIGYHFPDSDPGLKGIQSTDLLGKTVNMVRDAGYDIGNIDSTISLQEPKISPYIDRMKETLAAVLSLPATSISIKATTTEYLGFEGRGEGIVAYAVALIVEKSSNTP